MAQAYLPITTQTTPNLLLLTLNMVWWGRQLNKPHWERIFENRVATQLTEFTQEMMPVTLGDVKEEADPLPIGQAGQGPTTSYRMKTYGNSIYISLEELQDNQYKKDWSPRAMGFAQAQEVLRNLVVFNLFNDAKNTGSAGGDGLPLLSTTHLQYNGTYANTWSTPTVLNKTSYTQMVEGTQLFQNYTGYPLEYVPKLLLTSIQNAQNAKTLMFSPDDPTTANRAINSLFGDYFNEGMIISPYLRDPECFFGITTAEEGFIFWRRMPWTIQDLPGTNTLVYAYYGVERFAVGYAKANCTYGSTFLT